MTDSYSDYENDEIEDNEIEYDGPVELEYDELYHERLNESFYVDPRVVAEERIRELKEILRLMNLRILSGNFDKSYTWTHKKSLENELKELRDLEF